MRTHTVVVTTKRTLKVKAENWQEAMAKAYHMLMHFKQADVKRVPGLTMDIEVEDEAI